MKIRYMKFIYCHKIIVDNQLNQGKLGKVKVHSRGGRTLATLGPVMPVILTGIFIFDM